MRRTLAWVLLVSGCLFATVALVAVWADTLVLNRDRYVDAVGPLAGDVEVQEAVASVVVDAIMDQISPPIGEGATRALVEEIVAAVVKSDAFADLWTSANRLAHDQIVALLTGVDSDSLETRDGEVYLELGPVVAAVADDLSPLGLDISAIDAVAADTEFRILATDDLEPAHRWLRRIERTAFWFPPASAAAFGVAVWADSRRWRAAARSGIGLASGGILVLLAIGVARVLYRDRMVETLPDAVATRLFERLIDPLETSAIALAAVAAAVAASAFIGAFLAERLGR